MHSGVYNGVYATSNFKINTVFYFLFPLIGLSRFISLHYMQTSLLMYRVNLRLFLESKRKVRILPEIGFWFLFVLTHRFGLVSLFNKKIYSAGQMSYSRVYSMVVGTSYKFYKNVAFFKAIFNYFCIRSRLLNTYWFRFSGKQGCVHHFTFKDISFDERFYRLINVAPFYWGDIKAVISITLKIKAILYFVFLFRDFLKVPLENMRLRDKGIDIWTKELKKMDKKKFFYKGKRIRKVK